MNIFEMRLIIEGFFFFSDDRQVVPKNIVGGFDGNRKGWESGSGLGR